MGGRPLPGRGGGDRRGRPSRDCPGGGGEGGGRLGGAGGADRPRARARPRHPEAAPVRQPAPPRADPPRGPGRRRRGRGQRRIRDGDAGPGVPGPGVRPRGTGRGRRGRPLHRHPVAARRPRPAGCFARSRAGTGAAGARWRGRRVRGTRGPVDADPCLHAGAPHRPAGEDDVRARRVVLRPHPSPSRADALRAPRDPRGEARGGAGPDPARRRRVRVQLDGRVLQRGLVRVRPLRRAERASRRLRGLHRQPAVRSDARLRRRPDLLRPRVADGPPGRRARARPRRAAAPERALDRLHAAHRCARALPGAGGGAAVARTRDAASPTTAAGCPAAWPT